MKDKQRSKNDEIYGSAETGGGLGIEDIDAEAAENNFEDAESIFNQDEAGENEGYVDCGHLLKHQETGRTFRDYSIGSQAMS